MRKRILVLVLLLVLTPVMTSCGSGDAQFLIDLAMSWAVENAGSIAAYAAFGTSGNDEVDAVMDAKGVVDNINAADRLMEEGRQEGDLSKMEQAIEKRPGDYTYRVSYATALLKNGNTAQAEAQFEAADEAVLDYSGDHAQTYAIQGIDELGLLGPEFEQNGFKSAEQCRAYYGQMAYFYEIRMVEGGSYFEGQRDRFQALKAGCQ